jgi:hypothetical protein
MSGTIDVASVPRTTIPYGDRPIVDVNSGRPSMEFYQWASRLQGAQQANTTNIGTVITVVDTIVADVSTIQAEINTINNEIATIEAQIAVLSGAATPSPPAPVNIPGCSFETAFGIGFFFGA